MSRNGDVLIVCDDDIIIGLIENVLLKMEINKITRISIKDFICDMPIDRNTDLVIINEAKNTSDFLKTNRFLKFKYPHVMLIALTSYIGRDFDVEFINSGVNHVLPLGKLHGELTRICKGGL